MEIEVSLADLPKMHPRLLWDEITLATIAVLGGKLTASSYEFALTTQDMPGYDSSELVFIMNPGDVDPTNLARIRRTYDPARLVELAAIAIAGLGLYHGGGHEICDVAFRGTGADYTVGEHSLPLEVAGRSRRSDLSNAWEQRWRRLSKRSRIGFFLCVAEFETPAGRLAFAMENEE